MVFLAGPAWIADRGDALSLLVQGPREPLPATFLERLHRDDGGLFADEDIISWVVFTVAFIVLVTLDNLVWHRKSEEPTFCTAVLHTIFWVSCAVAFNVYIYFSRGAEPAVEWATGYILEFILSVDNLFVFHRIFEICRTPSTHRHACLFWGILGAIVFRMILLFTEQALLHNISWMHYLLGAFLIYTGFKVLMSSDEDEIQEDNVLMKAIAERLKCTNFYDDEPVFFIKVRIDPSTGEPFVRPAPDSDRALKARRSILRQSGDETRSSCSAGDGTVSQASMSTSAAKLLEHSASGLTNDTPRIKEKTPRFKEPEDTDFQEPPEFAWRGTKLLLVVVTLEIVDVIFAVDSVSAIVAQIPSLYLSYTACIFAMLGLRALFFVVDELVKLFALLSYGIAAILVLTGVKLCLKHWIIIEPVLMCIVIVSIFVLSILASLVYECCIKAKEGKDTESQDTTPARRTSGRKHSLSVPLASRSCCS